MFSSAKERCLTSVDLSRKGSIDLAIRDLVNFINKQNDYFTTSSCSGRICVFEEDRGKDVKKKGCVWLLTSHDPVTTAQVLEALKSAEGDAVFKFEAFVMHTQCRTLEHAQVMHSAAVASGFRNSGITVGKKGKIIMAVRSTHSLEVPLTENGELMVSEQYIKYIVNLASRKMEENVNRIDRFFENFKSQVEEQKNGQEGWLDKPDKKTKSKNGVGENSKQHSTSKQKTDVNLHVSNQVNVDEGDSLEYLSTMYDET